MLKKSIFFTFLLIIIFSSAEFALAQDKPRASPLKTVSQEVGGKTITISYSAPSKKDRKIWGGLVPYDKVWRTGANEATTIEVSDKVSIGEKTLEKGKYALFSIPNQDKWTIIINSNANQWGAYSYDAKKDVIRFDVKPESSAFQETFSIDVNEAGLVTIAWDELKVAFAVK